MPSCAVYGCGNYSKKTVNTDVRYYSFPKNEHLCKQWINVCQRKEQFNPKTARICSKHFHPSAFFESLKHKLLNYMPKNTRDLKEDAIPTEFLRNPKKTLNTPQAKGYSKQEKISGESPISELMSNVEIKTEDITEHFADGNGINYRKTCSEGKEDLKSVIGSVETDAEINYIKMKMIKVEQQEIDLNKSNEEMASSNFGNLNGDSCEYSTENDEKERMKTELLDFTEQFVDENGIYDRKIYTDEIKDLKFDIESVKTEQLEDNSSNNKYNSCDENSINTKDITSDYVSVLENKSNLKETRHKCHLCRYTSYNKVTIEKHIDAVHSNLKKYKCQFCDFTAKWARTLKCHVDSVHLNLRQHKCHLCDYAANQKIHLKVHIESAHLKQLECHLCEYAANNRRNLKNHIDSVHLNLRQYRCHLCDFSARRKFHLKTHIEIVHLKLKQHKCTLCDYASHYKKKLESHIESVHSGLK